MSGFLSGVVKAVNSGDTLVIVGAPAGGPPPEKTIKLSSISAPQLGWKDRADEPFAWDAREALREKAIGKPVTFRIDNAGGASNREYGDVYLGDESLAQWLVQTGWAKTRGSNKNDETQQKLKALEEAAEAEGLGMHNKDEAARAASIRNMQWKFDAAELYEQIQGTPVDAVVDQVRTGSTLRVILKDSFHVISVYITGIRCPGFTRAGKDQPRSADVPQPFALEAKYFTEIRLLHRDVQVVLDIPDDHGNFYGTILFPKGNIAETLLREGLAKVVDWSAAHVDYADVLRAAENSAKEKRIRVWRDYTPPVSSVAANDREFEAVVSEVVSGDTVMVQTAAGDRKLYLSSIRTPRLRRDKSEAFAFEAREFLRKRVIGKKVKVELDYVRQGDERFPDARAYATLIVNNKNVNVSLVNMGYATVIRHRDNEERSYHYDELMKSEAEASQKGVGVHAKKNKKAAAPAKRTDISRDGVEVAESLFGRIEGKRLPGVIEYVINGARMKVYIPKEDVIIPLVLEGIRCPRNSKDEPEPFGPEAAAFTKALVYQRDIMFAVAAVDRRGTFIGVVELDGEDIALPLLEEGLAYVNERSVDRCLNAEAYVAVNERAKAAKKGYWATYVEPIRKIAKPVELDDDESAGDSNKGPAKPEMYDVVVTELLSPVHFYLQVIGQGTEQLESMMAEFAAYHESAGDDLVPLKIKKGMQVSAKFSQDGAWYRARVTGTTETGDYNVVFIDYGNSEDVSKANIRSLPDQFTSLAPQARECFLAGVAPAPELQWPDIVEDSVQVLREHALGHRLVASLEFRFGDEWHVTLVDPETKTDFSVYLIRNGLARVKKMKGGRYAKLVQRLTTEQSAAVADQLGIWEYGEIDYDEPLDDDRGAKPARKKEEVKDLAGKVP